MIRLVAFLIITSLQTGSVGGREPARFRFVLPEGFNNWVCIDLGVAGAPALTQDEQGIFGFEQVKSASCRQ